MIEIFGVTYYTTWLATFLFCFISMISVPIIVIYFKVLRTNNNRLSTKRLLIIIGLFEFFIFGILHWDIIVAGHQVSKMCRKQGGLHIYQTVEADGMAGLLDIEYWSEYGFSYVEYVDSRGDIVRSTIINGEIVKKSVEDMQSQYMLLTKRENVASLVDQSFIKRINDSIVDRNNGNVLGELTIFTISQGWADHWIPGEYRPWSCGDKSIQNGRTVFLTVSGLVKEVVLPKNK